MGFSEDHWGNGSVGWRISGVMDPCLDGSVGWQVGGVMNHWDGGSVG